MVIACQQWTLTILFMISIISRSGKSQVPMPMPMPPMFMPPSLPMPVFTAPAAMPMPMPLPPPMPALPPSMPMFMPPPPPMVLRIKLPPRTTTTTTTTTESSAGSDNGDFGENGIAIPIPMPMPVQIGVPAMPPPMFCQGKSRDKGCPPCPPCLCAPSCTPAFFSYCSPCHKKCRCRSKEDTPEPRAIDNVPIPLPGPAFGVAFPPTSNFITFNRHSYKNKGHHGHEKRAADPGSDESSSSGSSERYRPRRRRPMSRHRRHHYRRSNRMDISDEFVRPEIAYISKDGEVKLSRPLTNDEAANLLGEGNFFRSNDTRDLINKQKQSSRVQVIATNNPGRSQVLVMQDKGTHAGNVFINKKRMLRSDVTPEFLASGRKHLIFKPPPDKTISNISVSFMVT